jgi:hypothetical protein
MAIRLSGAVRGPASSIGLLGIDDASARREGICVSLCFWRIAVSAHLASTSSCDMVACMSSYRLLNGVIAFLNAFSVRNVATGWSVWT